MGGSAEALTRKPDLLSIYSANCQLLPADQVPILIGSQKLEGSSELFYAPVLVSGKVTLRGMLDSGSMSCTLSEEAEKKLQAAGVLPSAQPIPGNVVIVGCGGKTTYPKCFYDLEVEVYESKFIVPTLVVPGQRDDFIIGTNVIKPVLRDMRKRKDYWRLLSSKNDDPECDRFLELLSSVSRWEGPGECDKIGTVKLACSVTLLPQQEHLVWGRLPADVPVSPGSTIIVEPTSARSAPKNILVGKLVTAMWGDRWVPMKILNPTLDPITLRRNAKIADVSPCLAMEDLNITQGMCRTQDVAPVNGPEQRRVSGANLSTGGGAVGGRGGGLSQKVVSTSVP